MDPNFIHMDWERTLDAISLVAVLAIVIERGLSVVFQSRPYIEHLHRDGMKEMMALGVSIAACAFWKLDAMGMIMLTATTTIPGYIVTGALVAGGSKGSVKLFEDFFNLQSSAFKVRRAIQANMAAAEAEKAEAEAKAAPNKAAAEVARAKAETAVKKVKDAAAKAAAEGKAVPSETLETADAALVAATRAVEEKKK